MANEIKLKRGSGSDPSASDLVVGEIAIRTDTGKLFTKKDDNSVAEISGGGIEDGDKGDITVSSSGATFTIDNDAVTYAKIQNVSATDRLLGRDSSGAGIIEEIAPSAVRTMLGLAASATTDTTNASNISSGTLAAARVATLNQDTTGNAATATALETARTIAGVSFDGTANISLNNNAITNGAGYLADIVSDTSPQLGGNLASNGNNINIADSTDGSTNRLTVGSGGDLQIFHDGTHSHIKNTGGNLVISDTNGDIYIQAKASEQSIIAKTDGAVELYFDNSKKLETTTNGIEVTGSIFLGGKIDMPDNSSGSDGKILLGTGDDLAIYHDGTNSRIENTTGKLLIKDDVIEFVRQADDTVSFVVNEGGATELYHNHNKKFETTSSGGTITGTLVADGFTGPLTGNVTGNASGSSGSCTGTAAIATTITVADESSDTTCFPVFSTSNSGNIAPKTGSNLTFNSSNGTLTATAFSGDGSALTGISAGATGGGSDEVFYENDQTVTTNYTITNGKNAMAAGPITINSGVTVTVGSGETLTIV